MMRPPIPTKKKPLLLPTPEEHNAMLGDSLWPQSTGAGLGNLAQNGRQKVKAIEQAKQQDTFEREVKALPDYKPAGEETTIPSLSILAQINPLTPRTQEEQNAVTGLTMFPKSTGAATAPLAQQVLAREKAEKQSALYLMRVKERAKNLWSQSNVKASDALNQAKGWANNKAAQIRNDVQKQYANIVKGPIDHSGEAAARYLFGDGSPQELSESVREKIRLHPDIQKVLKNLKAGTDDPSQPRIDPNFERDLEFDTFHLGRTKIYYNEVCENGTCTTTFTGPFLNQKGNPDRFENPLDLPEMLTELFGINLEIPGAKPYEYSQFSWQETYPDPRKGPNKP